MKLEGKIAMVTGAGGGMGRAIAMRYAQEGATVAVNDIRSDHAEKTVEDIISNGGKAKAFSADVCSSANVNSMVDDILKAFGKIDILFNNAGILIFQRIIDMGDEMWDRVIKTNLYGSFYCTRAVLSKSMMDQKSGRIIFMASVSPYVGGPMVASYGASKGGVVGLMRATAKEVAYLGITANAIAPGYMVTGMTKSVYRGGTQKRLEEKIALGRLGQPEDISGAAVFLASEDSSYITSHVLFVDGGSI